MRSALIPRAVTPARAVTPREAAPAARDVSRPGPAWTALTWRSAEPQRRDAPGAAVRESLATPGQPLSESVRGGLESAFGADFGAVRVHADARAARAADAVHARAFSVGQHLVFGRGEYEPHTSSGRDLLTHELAHARQQGPVALGAHTLAVTQPGEPSELAAGAAVRAVREGRRPPSAERAPARIARQPKPGAPENKKDDDAARQAEAKKQQEQARKEAEEANKKEREKVLRPATTIAAWPAKSRLTLDVGVTSLAAEVLSTNAETDTVELQLMVPARITLTLKDVPPPAATASGAATPTQALSVKVGVGLTGGDAWPLPVAVPDIPVGGAPASLGGTEVRTGEGRTELGAEAGVLGFTKWMTAISLTRSTLGAPEETPEVKPVQTQRGRVASIQDLFPFAIGDRVSAKGPSPAVLLLAALGGMSQEDLQALRGLDQSFEVVIANPRTLRLHADLPVKVTLHGVTRAGQEDEPPDLEVSVSALGRELVKKTVAVKRDGDAFVVDTPFGPLRLARTGAEVRLSRKGLQLGAFGPAQAPAYPPPAPWNLLATPYDARLLRPDLEPGPDFLFPPLGLRYDAPWVAGTRPLASYMLKEFASDTDKGNLPREALLDTVARYFSLQYGVRLESGAGRTAIVAPTAGVSVALPFDHLTFHGSLGAGLPTDLGQVFKDPGEAVDFGAYLDLAFGSPGGAYTGVVRLETGTGDAPSAALLVFQLKR